MVHSYKQLLVDLVELPINNVHVLFGLNIVFIRKYLQIQR